MLSYKSYYSNSTDKLNRGCQLNKIYAQLYEKLQTPHERNPGASSREMLQIHSWKAPSYEASSRWSNL